MRLTSLGWAVSAALAAATVAAAQAWPGTAAPGAPALLDGTLRSAGSGFFYGLLAFHLQRVDPDDSHLQAGLVGAVCGLRSLGASAAGALLQPLPSAATPAPELAMRLFSAMMGLMGVWLPLWLPLIGSALLLQAVQRWLPSRT